MATIAIRCFDPAPERYQVYGLSASASSVTVDYDIGLAPLGYGERAHVIDPLRQRLRRRRFGLGALSYARPIAK